jgi:hypothetical protein
MFRALAICLKQINPYVKIRAAGILSDNRPAIFCA